MSLVAELAKYSVDLKYDKIPAEAIIAAKTCILDSLGNMLYGRYSEMGNMAMDYIAANPEAIGKKVMIPGGESLPSGNAVFAMGVMSRCADLDDGHRYAMGHPGSILVPVLLAYGQESGKSAEEQLEALIAGYEVYIRVGASINPTSYRERGFESTSVTGTVACTVTIGKLFDVTEAEMANALGIASLFACGLIEYQNDGSMGKVLGGIWAIETAMKAVKLAKSGFTGARFALEGKKGFIQAFSNEPAPEKVTESLDTFKIGEVYFKMHACMRGLHAAVDAAIDLKEQEHITEEQIKTIRVCTTPFVGRLSKPHPTTVVGAQSSIEFALAAALINGHIASEDVLVSAMGKEETYELASRVKLVMDDEVNAYFKENPSHWGAVRLEIQLTDGRIVKKFNPLPKGEAENPFTWEQLCGKFCHLLKETPYEAYGEELCRTIENYESEEITSLLAPWQK